MFLVLMAEVVLTMICEITKQETFQSHEMTIELRLAAMHRAARRGHHSALRMLMSSMCTNQAFTSPV